MSSLSASLAVLRFPIFVPLGLSFALYLAFSGGHEGTAPTFYFRIFVQQSLVKNGVIV